LRTRDRPYRDYRPLQGLIERRPETHARSARHLTDHRTFFGPLVSIVSSQSNIRWWKSERAIIAECPPAPSAARERSNVFGPESGPYTSCPGAARASPSARASLAKTPRPLGLL